ncbi:hypothetical protein E2P81_ATG10222 [Venturia nashicola]|nr:hypothetical protein E2P81_ATG10222 [Venturia nashicola]
MHAMSTFAALTAGMAVVANAQQSQDNNAAVDILSCSDLEQVQLDSGAVCEEDQTRATGVGIAADVFTVGDTSLSLTLVDSGSDGAAGSGYQSSTQMLYTGVPSDFDVSEQPPACALMLQYQGQTLPNMTGPSDNSTSCSDTFSDSCLDTMTEAIQAFEYSSSNNTGGGSNQLPQARCDMLASHVREYLMPNLSFCGLWTSFVNITGGPMFGPNASSESSQPQESGGQHVSPDDYQLHTVVSMTQLFRPGGDEFPDADNDASNDLQEPVRGAGRQGTTPVVGVFYSNEDDTEPMVEFACMRTFTPTGEPLPNQLNFPDSSDAVAKSVGHAVIFISVAALLSSLL